MGHFEGGSETVRFSCAVFSGGVLHVRGIWMGQTGNGRHTDNEHSRRI